MAYGKKIHRKIVIVGLFFAIAIPTIFILVDSIGSSKVEILYFRNDKCSIIKNTDSMINQTINEFGNRIDIEIINAQLYANEPNDTKGIKQLREKYNVIGLPEIIINGKEFTKEFTKENLFSEICNNFIIKPEACG